MAETSPFLPPGGLADFASVSAEADLTGEAPPVDAVCDPPLDP
jgi:hypothetical protein